MEKSEITHHSSNTYPMLFFPELLYALVSVFGTVTSSQHGTEEQERSIFSDFKLEAKQSIRDT